MTVGIYSALSGIKVKEQELEVVANNIANVNTTGFKEEQMTFEAILSKTASNQSKTPFVAVKEKKINFTEGPLMTTNNTFDLAIQGDGFFEIQNENGSFLSRNGQFVLNNNGELVNSDGDKVLGKNGLIQIEPGSNVKISPAGIINVDGEDKGQIKVVAVNDKTKMDNVGGNLFKLHADATTSVDENSQILQGKLEQSNTNVMRSIVKLIDISRQYQSYQKIVSNQTKLEQEAVSSLGRIG